MKRLIRIMSLTMGLFGIYACQNDMNSDDFFNPAPLENIPPAKHLEFIKEMGFDLADLKDRGDYYLVEGDILLKKEIIDTLSNSETRHRYNPSRGFVTTENQIIKWHGNLSVGYSPSFNDAVKEWNALPDCNIQFVYVNSSSQADVIVNQVEDRYLTEALNVVFPFDGKPGNRIDMNLKGVNLPNAMTEKEKLKYMFMHALGHVIGFAHTPRDNKDDVDRNTSNISNTVAYDPSSIMTKDTYPHSWSGFSQNDKQAFARVYPIPGWTSDPPVITGPSGELKSGRSYVFSASVPYPGKNMKYYWSVPPKQGKIIKDEGSKVTIRFHQFNEPERCEVWCSVVDLDIKEGTDTGIKKVTVTPTLISLSDNKIMEANKSGYLSVEWDIENPEDYNYLWDIPAGLNAQSKFLEQENKQILSILNGSTPGEYEIKLKVTRGNSYESEILSSHLTILPPVSIPDVTLVHGEWTTIEVDWDIPNRSDYTFTWTIDPFIEYRIIGDGRLEAKTISDFWFPSPIRLYIRGKNHEFHRTISPKVTYMPNPLQETASVRIFLYYETDYRGKFQWGDYPVDEFGWGLHTYSFECPVGDNNFHFKYEMNTPQPIVEAFEFNAPISSQGAVLAARFDDEGIWVFELFDNDREKGENGDGLVYVWCRGM